MNKVKLAILVVGILVLWLSLFTYKKHEELAIPHAPHSAIQFELEKFLSDSGQWKAGQHGPNVKCTNMCAPEGFEDETRESFPDLHVITCSGNLDPMQSCAKQGSQCNKEHRPGCAEHCRSQCCSCCSI
jgi:hypothetical protein